MIRKPKGQKAKRSESTTAKAVKLSERNLGTHVRKQHGKRQTFQLMTQDQI